MDDQTNNIELQRLKKENQLLKELLRDLPFSFQYQNSKFGSKVFKSERHSVPSIKDLCDIGYGNEFLITSRFDEFEHIEAFLTTLLDLVPHHIVFVDHFGIITLCNLQVAKDLQVDRDKMIGRHIRELLQIPDDQIAVIKTIKTGRELYDKEILDKNYGIINTRILRNQDGSIKRVIGIFQFLNAIKEAEKQALAGRIAAGIAHEIRNPLTTIRGYLQFLESKVDPEIDRLFSTLLIPEIDRANKIISDFLSVAKPAATRTEVMNVKQFLIEYLGKFLKSEALLYNAHLEIEVSPKTERLSILCNREELLQVFMNLFQNSIQANIEHPLHINISTVLLNSSIQIIFMDNGQGIHSSILSHIFDPFFTTKDNGTGLGLSVSRKIIENHGGSMNAVSNDEGTKFTVELPVVTERSSD